MIQAKVIADSKSWTGARLTTMIVTFPRFILAEFNTHRVFSRNSASSRAIPFAKMVQMVQENPFIPIAWQKDHKGMQGSEYFTSEDNKIELSGGGYHSHIDSLRERWLSARNTAVERAKDLNGLGVTKQLCNRLLEPFMWHTVIVSATEWENFFELRCPKYEIFAGPEDTDEYRCHGRSWKDLMKSNSGLAGDFNTNNIVERLSYNKGQSEIHMMALAEAMWDAYNESVPKELQPGEWHIPFGDNIDESEILSRTVLNDGQIVDMKPTPFFFKDGEEGAKHWYQMQKVKIATARCARISYQTFGDDPKVDYAADIKLHDMLAASGHWSPFEHCAQVVPPGIAGVIGYAGKDRNFGSGFVQYRAMMEEK